MQDQWKIHWQDYYHILQIDLHAERDVIEAAYKKLALKYHSDNKETGDEAKMRLLNEAHEVLSDRSRRARYDADYRIWLRSKTGEGLRVAEALRRKAAEAARRAASPQKGDLKGRLRRAALLIFTGVCALAAVGVVVFTLWPMSGKSPVHRLRTKHPKDLEWRAQAAQKTSQAHPPEARPAPSPSAAPKKAAQVTERAAQKPPEVKQVPQPVAPAKGPPAPPPSVPPKKAVEIAGPAVQKLPEAKPVRQQEVPTKAPPASRPVAAPKKAVQVPERVAQKPSEVKQVPQPVAPAKAPPASPPVAVPKKAVQVPERVAQKPSEVKQVPQPVAPAKALVERKAADERFEKAKKSLTSFEEAKARLDRGEYEAALKAFRATVKGIDTEEAAAMLPAAWFNIGRCYHSLDRHYEAGLVFEELAQRYPKSQLAATAARSALDSFTTAYGQTPCDHAADLCVDAFALYVERFPQDPDAPRLAFQLGEILRRQKQFLKAAEVYSAIPPNSEYYGRACYQAGDCGWQAFLDLAARDRTKARSAEGRHLADRAIGRLTQFIEWGRKAPKTTDERDKDRLHWTALARMRLADIHLYESARQPQPALEVLRDFEALYPAEQASFPVAACRRVQALVWMGRLPDAIQEMEKIITQYGTRNPKAVSDAARTLGATCAAVVEKPGAGLQPADVEAYRGSATGYLKLAIDVYPDQPFADYEAIGDKLMALGDYANAAQILAQGRTRCSPPAPVQRSALAKEADCCFNIRQWERALGRYKQLDESVKDDREKGLAFKENIGLCYENMGMWDQALSEAWNVLDANLPRTSPKWFEARAHQVHCLAMLKDDAGAWKNFAEVIRSTWPAVGGPEIKKQFDDLLERDLPTHKAEYEALTKGLPERK